MNVPDYSRILQALVDAINHKHWTEYAALGFTAISLLFVALTVWLSYKMKEAAQQQAAASMATMEEAQKQRVNSEKLLEHSEKQLLESQRQRQLAVRPLVILSAKRGPGGSIRLFFRNIGRGPAFHIACCSPEMDERYDAYVWQDDDPPVTRLWSESVGLLEENSEVELPLHMTCKTSENARQNPDTLLPSERLRDEMKKGSVPFTFSVLITYLDLYRISHTTTSQIAFTDSEPAEHRYAFRERGTLDIDFISSSD